MFKSFVQRWIKYQFSNNEKSYKINLQVHANGNNQNIARFLTVRTLDGEIKKVIIYRRLLFLLLSFKITCQSQRFNIFHISIGSLTFNSTFFLSVNTKKDSRTHSSFKKSIKDICVSALERLLFWISGLNWDLQTKMFCLSDKKRLLCLRGIYA